MPRKLHFDAGSLHMLSIAFTRIAVRSSLLHVHATMKNFLCVLVNVVHSDLIFHIQ